MYSGRLLPGQSRFNYSASIEVHKLFNVNSHCDMQEKNNLNLEHNKEKQVN